MAVIGSYRVKRQRRRQLARGTSVAAVPEGRARLIPVGTVASLGLAMGQSAPGAHLSVWIGGRYEARVGPGFEEATLARLVRTLERLA